RYYRLAVGAAEAAAAGTPARRAPSATEAARRALAFLGAHPEGATRAALKAAGVGEGVLRRLLAQGMVAAFDRPVERAALDDPEAWSWPQSGTGGSALQLTPGQREALAAIRAEAAAERPRPVLLHGVTGSGKTEVYLRAVAETLALGRSAIVLVPEIALTPQSAARFRERFGRRVAVLHSRLSAGERFDEWRRLASGEAVVALGARSAVFAPVRKLGLVVVDEEQEGAYKQEEAPRYHAREVALARAAAEGAVAVLGSATPSVESYYRALQGDFRLAELGCRPLGRALPAVEVVDMRAELASGNREIFSRRLQEAIRERLSRGEQAVLFLNRRGFSRVVLCRACGLVVRCPVCQVALTYHASEDRLVCHYCQHRTVPPVTCPSCGSRYIRHFGVGTEKVEAEVGRLFPEARPVRMDVDTTRRKGAHARILGAFARGEYNVLVGTQMIAKGLDLPGVTLVGVVAGDTALGLPDFRAAERTFTMLTQVAGRAGRGGRPGEVIVQTYNPEHYSIVAASRHDYRLFYEQEIAFRRAAGYPPFGELVLLTVAGAREEMAQEGAEALAKRVREAVGGSAAVLGPNPAPLARLRGLYRFHVLVKGVLSAAARGAVRRAAEEVLKENGKLRVNWDVDPQALL
ncbi:MAG TPA: primosomal protein N', partial [Firmicutes bacterium]|nr:primosomal protein N' [Bacillota bacterium]